MIITLTQVKTYLGISDTSLDTKISRYIPIVDAAVKEYCNDDIEWEFTASYTINEPNLSGFTFERTPVNTRFYTHDTADTYEVNTTIYRYTPKLSQYFKVGDQIEGEDIPAGAYIIRIREKDLQIVLSDNCTATGSAQTLNKNLNMAYLPIVASIVKYAINGESQVIPIGGIQSKSQGPTSVTYNTNAGNLINGKFPEYLFHGLPRKQSTK